jgi:TolA-binding protein
MGKTPKILLFVLSCLISIRSFSVELEISSKKSGYSFQFFGQDTWDYKVELKGRELIMRVPMLSESSVKKLHQLNNEDVRFVKLETDQTSSGYVVILLVKDHTDYFDYILQKPSRLVIDLYSKNVVGKVEKTTQTASSNQEQKNKIDNKIERTPSTTDLLEIKNAEGAELDLDLDSKKSPSVGLFDASDKAFSRFKIPLSEIEPNPLLKYYLGNYIDYPFLDERLSILQTMKENMPEYRIEEAKEGVELRENERDHAKLLVTLFNRNRNFIFIKTANWFLKTYPKSYFEEIVRAMWADTHYKVYLSDPIKNRKHLDLAKSRYEELIEKFPQSELVSRLHIFMGYSSIEGKDYISALRWFQRFLNRFPDSEVLDIARLGVIRSLVGANQTAEAKAEIESIKQTTCATKIDCKIKADLLLADISIYKKDWGDAERIYASIFLSYPLDQIKEERFFYNYASVLFSQKKFLKALDMYLEFITRYPNDDFAGYALTRIGEIIDLNSTNSNRALGAYLEANFRYGTQPGSTALFARIRVLEKQLPHLQGRARQAAINEIAELAKRAKLPMAEDFGNFIISEQLANSGAFDESLGYLIPNYRERPTHPLIPTYFSKIQDIQAKKIRDFSKKNPIEALKYHELMQIDWLKNTKRVDVSYSLAECYMRLGDFKSAERYYEESLKLLDSFKKDSIEDQVMYMRQNPPTPAELLLKIADTQKNQGHWISVAKTLEELDKRNISLSQDQKILRASLLSQVLNEKGQVEYSLRYLRDMRKIASETNNRSSEVLFKELEALKKGQDHKAIVELSKEIEEVCLDVSLDALCYYAGRDILVSQKKVLNQNEYQSKLTQFIDRYHQNFNVDDLRYELGQLFLKQKNIKQAEKIWSQFKNQNSGWAQLAKSDLEGAKFDQIYQEYFNKIPSLSRASHTSKESVNE